MNTLSYLKSACLAVDTECLSAFSYVHLQLGSEQQTITATDGKILVRYTARACDDAWFFDRDSMPGEALFKPSSLPALQAHAKSRPTMVFSLPHSDGKFLKLSDVSVPFEPGRIFPNVAKAIAPREIPAKYVSPLIGVSARYLSIIDALAYPLKGKRDDQHGLRIVTDHRGIRIAPMIQERITVFILLMPISLPDDTSTADMGVALPKVGKT